MSQFEIRPPESFRFIKSIEEPITHAKTYYWVGPARDDETYPQFMVIITELSARDSKTPLANLLKDMLRGIEQRSGVDSYTARTWDNQRIALRTQFVERCRYKCGTRRPVRSNNARGGVFDCPR